jgi:hypothetical protein
VAPVAAWYVPDLVLTWLFGARATLAWGPPLHVFLAMAGAFRLGRVLGFGAWGAWTAGALFGFSGFLLSCVSLLPLLQASAWAPLIISSVLRLVANPSPRRTAAVAAALVLQISTLLGEIVVQTALFALALLPRRPGRRAVAATAFALALALLALAPVLFPLLDGLRDTARRLGLDPQAALAERASAPMLLEGVVPHFLGSVHTMTDRGYWGQPFFPGGFPYLLSVYVGPTLLLLAIRSGQTRLIVLAALGLLLSLGGHGPFALPLSLWARLFRAPVKFLFLTTLALCLAAAAGVERPRVRWAGGLLGLVPGLLLLAVAAFALIDASALSHLLSRLIPEIDTPRALEVIAHTWPLWLFVSGALALAAGIALLGPARLRPLAALMALLDLAIINAPINETAPSSFFDLRPTTKDLLAQAAAPGPWRLFSFGAADTAPLHWSPAVVARNSDLSLYFLDRQALAPRTHILDGLSSAFDEDRTGFAPLGSTLPPSLRRPEALREILPHLRWANVRYLLSFASLPEDLVRLVGEAFLPEVQEPLRLYEIPNALPRAFYLPEVLLVREDGKARVVIDEAQLSAINARGARIDYHAEDPHTVEVHAESGPGWIIVLDGFDPRWHVEGSALQTVRSLRAQTRYQAIATPGGARTLRIRFVPNHRRLALGLSLASLLLMVAAALRGSRDALASTWRG